jgi:hypothetical protein
MTWVQLLAWTGVGAGLGDLFRDSPFILVLIQTLRGRQASRQDEVEGSTDFANTQAQAMTENANLRAYPVDSE